MLRICAGRPALALGAPARLRRPAAAIPAAAIPAPRRTLAVCSALGMGAPDQLKAGAYEALRDSEGVFLVSSQEAVAVTSLWAEDERCVVALGRSMG